jgi:hypothetical protein
MGKFTDFWALWLGVFAFTASLTSASEVKILRHGCWHNHLVWACYELGQTDFESDDQHYKVDPIACYRSKLSGGLPPIVVPPVIASFDAFAVALRLNSFQIFSSVRQYCERGISRMTEGRFGLSRAFLNGLPGSPRVLSLAYRETNPSRAKQLIEYSCRHDRAQDCVAAGRTRWGAQDLKAARYFFIRGCLAKNTEACAALANWDHLYGTPKEEWTARYIGCTAGDQSECKYFRPVNIFEFASVFYKKTRARRGLATSVTFSNPSLILRRLR